MSLNTITSSVGNSRIAPSISARNLGVIFDNHMSLDKQNCSICKSAFFHLRNIGSTRNMLTDDACSQLIHSLVTVRIDYCNSLLYGMPDSTLFRLQKVLNTAARILKKIPKFSHITDNLKDLHWLPIRQRITFKILLLTYQAYHNTAPEYLCELITPYCSARNLRSNDMMLVILDRDSKFMEKSVFSLLDLKSGITYPCLFVKVLPFIFLNHV